MDGKRTRRLLIVAFALSLLLHVIVTFFIRWPFRPSPDEVQIVHIERLRPMRIAHVVKVPPTPSPPPRHVAVSVPKRSFATSAPGGRGGRGVAVTPAPTTAAQPTPTAAPTQNCATNDTPVQLVASPPPPDIASGARGDAVSGVARVRVIVDPQGNVESASVVSSSGSPALDLVAQTMARSAAYSPATHACKAVASAYVFSVKFIAW